METLNFVLKNKDGKDMNLKLSPLCESEKGPL